MAITQLSLMGTPGGLTSFSPKGEAGPVEPAGYVLGIAQAATVYRLTEAEDNSCYAVAAAVTRLASGDD